MKLKKNPSKSRKVRKLIKELSDAFLEWVDENPNDKDDQILMLLLDVADGYLEALPEKPTLEETLTSCGGLIKTIMISSSEGKDFYEIYDYCIRYFSSLASETINALKELNGKLIDGKDHTLH